ncbi:MAG: alpha-E domain-containing protein [Planctomycetota bacterium]|nr:alpha-E domain-containing protein [Planctomycetota bacterium]
MLSRVADSILWMARYVERAENLARFIDVTLNLQIDMPGSAHTQWEPLVRATGDDEKFKERYGEFNEQNVITFLTFDRKNSNSILTILRAARENARSIRETISSETWEQLNAFYHFVRDAADTDAVQESPGDFFLEVKHYSHLLNGVTDSTMSHNEGWHFSNMGRLLERADKTSRILDVKYFTLLPRVEDVGSPVDDLQWSAVLRSVSGFEMYRKRYHGITVERIVEFLVLDREFPRAIQYCLAEADNSLHAISGTAAGTFVNPAEQHLGRLRAELAFCDVKSIINQGLHEFVDSLQTQLNLIGEGITDTFIDPKTVV